MSKLFDFSDFRKEKMVNPVDEVVSQVGQAASDFYDKKIMEAMTAPNPLLESVQREDFLNYLREYPTLKWWQFLRKRKVEREIARLAMIVVPKLLRQIPEKQNVIRFRRYGKINARV